MPHFPSLPADAGPAHVFKRHPDIYAPWAAMSEALMNGPSPLSQGERELLLAYAAGAAGCEFVAVAHAEVVDAWGAPRGLVELLLSDPDSAPLEPRMRPLLAFFRNLATKQTAPSGKSDTSPAYRCGSTSASTSGGLPRRQARGTRLCECVRRVSPTID